ncbi:MAG: UDP-N-acetylglucosamine 1-carboxyvinyltransferase [Christensenellales bacterium]
MEEKIIIRGGKPLIGEVTVSGAKNSAVAVIPAALLSDGICTIENLPDIEDVNVLRRMLSEMKAKVEFQDDTMVIDPSGVDTWRTPADLVHRMRASNYMMGALLARFGKAEVAFPGGCDIGERPMDQHIKGLTMLGTHIELKRGIYFCQADRLTGAEVYLDVVSVGATINIMLAAARAEGTTTIVNAAKEPHVVDLANFLGAMGARIKGAGTDTIRITGRPLLHGCTYRILPDPIETGTWMAIAAATRGDITIRGCIPYHLEAVSAKLMEMGMNVIEGEDFIRVIGTSRPRPVQIKTLAYPGFPTDLQQPFTVLLSVASGTSMVIENIFESRFRHVDELRRMGAQIRVQDRVAVIDGVESLWGSPVNATDLRGSAALIIAGLIADGYTQIGNVRYIDRGYERIVEKLAALGADIRREMV